MKTRRGAKRDIEAEASYSNCTASIKKKSKLKENEEVYNNTNTRPNLNSNKMELSSDSSSDEFVRVGQIDLDSEFFKIKKLETDFSAIESKILSGVSHLSDSEESEQEEGAGLGLDAPLLPDLWFSQSDIANSKQHESVSKTKPVSKSKSSKTRPNKRTKPSLKKHSAKLNKTNSESMDVSQLLALGEGPSNMNVPNYEEPLVNRIKNSPHSSDDEVSDWEDVETSQPLNPTIPKEGVQVTLKLPNMFQNRKKRGFDWEAHVKRRINRVKRDIQVLIHKVHLLCLLAHGLYINSILNSNTLMGLSLSLLPSDDCYPPKHADISYLEKFVLWFTKTISINKKPVVSTNNSPLIKLLEEQFEKKAANSIFEGVLMFVCILRTLGLKVRLVMSFQPLPLKPHGDELCSINTKEKNGKVKDKAIKQEDGKVKDKAVKQKDGKVDDKDVKQEVEKVKEKAVKQEDRTVSSKYFEGTSMTKDDSDFEPESPKKRGVHSEKRRSSAYLIDNDFEPSTALGKKSRSTSKGKLSSGKRRELQTDPDGILVHVRCPVLCRCVITLCVAVDGGEGAHRKLGNDCWAEVFVEEEEKWICVDISKGKIHCVSELYSRATHPVTYVVAFNVDQTVRDVTRRYCSQYHVVTRKQRVAADWWEHSLRPWRGSWTSMDKEEEEDLEQQLHDRPLPSSLSEYKNHPLYVLRKDLLKFEAIYPPDAPTLGFIRGQEVFARECVKNLHSRETWVKEAKVVRLGEKPYKIVKARPKYDRCLNFEQKSNSREFLHEGGDTVNGLNRVAKKLNIDCAPAVVGFDFHCGGSHPTYDGFVVCEEFVDILLDAWDQRARSVGKINMYKRVYGNWRRLIKGLLIRERLQARYSFERQEDSSKGKLKVKKRKLKSASESD
uniref:Uncharacterized protein n=1 Tax=Timema cristinae TaxID=61476 RepID=A0A7R9GUD3_TIMCR|nr:unnamed protein product [Timema cristinae]